MSAFYVINAADLNLSFDETADSSEVFATREDAERRAIELAIDCPGATYEVVTAVSFVVAQVGPATVTKLS